MKYVSSQQVLTEMPLVPSKSIQIPASEAAFVAECPRQGTQVQLAYLGNDPRRPK